MSQEKKKKKLPVVAEGRPVAEESAENDPHACLRLPPHPPQANITLFAISLALFFLWFAYLVIVAWRG